MDNYYVEFVGELKDDKMVRERFARHYNKWCKVINAHLEELNALFDKEWKGEPIQNYGSSKEYNDWMILQYKDILKQVGMNKDLLLKYDFDDEMQLYGIGKYGVQKGKRISFIVKKG